MDADSNKDGVVLKRAGMFILGVLFGICAALSVVLLQWNVPALAQIGWTIPWLPSVVDNPHLAKSIAKLPAIAPKAYPQPTNAALVPITLTPEVLPTKGIPAAPVVEVPAIPMPSALPASPVIIQPSGLQIPVAGIKASQLIDTFTDARSGGRVHDAIDIMAAKGTAVLAATDGKVAKLFNSKQGGLTIYQFDSAETTAYYYAHLDSYAAGLAEGGLLKRGDLIGYVGSTGNASPDAPHLHFAVFVLGPEKKWWQGTAMNPYPLLALNKIDHK